MLNAGPSLRRCLSTHNTRTTWLQLPTDVHMSEQMIYVTSTINFSRKKYTSLAAIFQIRLVSNTLFLNQSNILWHRIFIFHPFHRRHWFAIRTWAFHSHWQLYLTRGICEMHNRILSSKFKGTIWGVTGGTDQTSGGCSLC